MKYFKFRNCVSHFQYRKTLALGKQYVSKRCQLFDIIELKKLTMTLFSKILQRKIMNMTNYQAKLSQIAFGNYKIPYCIVLPTI